MSQRPKSGAPARAASASKAGPKDAVANAEPITEATDVEVPAVTEEPAQVEPAQVEAEVSAQPAINEEPMAEAEPAGAVAMVPAEGASYSVHETMVAASDLAAASAKAVSATLTATADTVAAVTAEAVETAASIEPTKPTLTRGIRSMMKSTEDFVAFGQANLEAFVKSGQIWSAGVQELTKQIATSAKASFDESVSTFKAMSTAKSVKEAMDLQSSFAKAALEKAMSESNKLTDASIKLTEQTLAPITARVTVAVETFGKAA
jgi:phasin family protein